MYRRKKWENNQNKLITLLKHITEYKINTKNSIRIWTSKINLMRCKNPKEQLQETLAIKAK